MFYINNFCASKVNIEKVKLKATEWEEILGTHIITDDVCASIITKISYKSLRQNNDRKQRSSLKVRKDTKRAFGLLTIVLYFGLFGIYGMITL